MGNVATNVSTGKPNISGAVYVAPLGATVPTDATTALDTTKYVCLGYVSEDGLENSNDMDVSAIKAWGGMIVYRSLNELNDNFSLTLIESENVDVLKAVYGSSNVTSSNGVTHVEIKAEDPQEMVWVFELALRNNTAKRIVIPDGAITAREAITYNDADPIGYGITISAYPDSNGKTHDEYLESATISG